jgi:hypothetical protein
MSDRTAMKEKPEIVFPVGTWCVTTGEIPRLIAEALHPKPPENAPITITQLSKVAKPEASEESRRWNGWPIDDDDRKILNEIWADLPPLNLPVTEEAWQPYITAFREHSSLDWDLDWLKNNPSLNAGILRHAAINEQTEYLRNAINSGDLKQLHPASSIPTTAYLEHGIVTVEALTAYVAKFSIEIRLAPGETAAISRGSKGRPPEVKMKAKILSLLIESMTKERNIDPGSLPGSVANLLDACQRIEKAKTGKERVFSTTVTTFKEWLSNTGYGFGSGRPPKKETTYWTSLCVETMGKIDAEVFTEVVDETAP